MTDAQLDTAILDALAAQDGKWIIFDQLCDALPWDASEKSQEARRARLRGSIARGIHAGRILRQARGQVKYALAPIIAETIDLFSQGGAS